MQALFLLSVMHANYAKAQSKSIRDTFVVIRVQKNDACNCAVVSFTPSARVYKLPKSNRRYFYYLSLLRSSEKNKTIVIIKRASTYSDTILTVQPYHKK